MISKNSFDGGLRYGPKTFAEITGRNRVWRSGSGPVARAPRPCPNCGASDAERLWVTANPEPGVAGWEYSRCKCGMVYTVMAPTPSELDRVYKSGGAQQEWVRLQQNSTELEIDRLKFRWALEKAGWPFGGYRILDIGCSTGTLLCAADEMAVGLEGVTAGVEINAEAAEVCRSRLNPGPCPKVLRPRWLDDKIGSVSGPFDLVVLWEVLEHVLEPEAMLARAWDLVAPGGKLMLCVPNFASYAVMVLREHCPCFGLGHINMWTPDTLDSLLGDLSPAYHELRMETIVSWQREVANWMAGCEPTASDDWEIPVGLAPSADTIHQALAGYKLVAFVENPA